MSVGGGRRRRGGGGFSDINVTPLVDVMLVLLVVFMVTAPLLTAGLRVELPNVSAEEAPTKDTKLVVTVTKEEKILFGEDDATADIEGVLASNGRVQKEKELYIRADKDARYGAVARVVAAARAAGVEGLNLLVQPEIEPEGAPPPPGGTAPRPGGAAPRRGGAAP
ncbi:biopolymer transporter ExbD [Sorangium sp. So ce145]|uniref:Transport transmembrane protein n=3 Tax=Sorangium TaxID=39643 RepID=A9EN12_SORC5|nr:putative transport transmembrane protein [Sorangium cellulosum So ce56]